MPIRGPLALSDEQRIQFFRWIVGVPAIAGTSGLPDLVVQHLMERLDEVIASDTLRAGLLPRAPHVIPQLMKTLRDEGGRLAKELKRAYDEGYQELRAASGLTLADSPWRSASKADDSEAVEKAD